MRQGSADRTVSAGCVNVRAVSPASSSSRSTIAGRSPGRCRSGGMVMWHAANRRRKSARNRPSRTSVSRSRDVEATSREREVDRAVPRRDMGFAVAQQPREPALGGGGKLVDVVEEQRAGSCPGGWPTRVPGPPGRGARAPGRGPEKLFVDVGRLCRPAVDRDHGRATAAAVLEGLEERLRPRSGFAQQQHRGASGGGERKRRTGTAGRVRPADQWQRDLDRRQRGRRPPGRDVRTG